MSDPKNRPRDVAVHPRNFGRGAPMEWLEDAPRPLVVAAKLQNDLAHRVASHIRASNQTNASFGAKLGWSADRVGRLLRGEQAMRLEDVTAVTALLRLSIKVEQAPARPDSPQ